MDSHGVVALPGYGHQCGAEAANADTLVERATREAGIEIDVIEGVEEAG